MNVKKTKKSMNFIPYLLLIAFVCGAYLYLNTFGRKVNTLDYNELVKELANNNVTEIDVTPKSSSGIYVITGKLEGYKKTEIFSVSVPYTDTVISSIYSYAENNNLKVTTNSNPENSIWLTILFNVVPFIMIGALLYVMFVKLGNNGKGTFDFGKSRAKLSENGGTKTFKDVAGLKEAMLLTILLSCLRHIDFQSYFLIHSIFRNFVWI